MTVVATPAMMRSVVILITHQKEYVSHWNMFVQCVLCFWAFVCILCTMHVMYVCEKSRNLSFPICFSFLSLIYAYKQPLLANIFMASGVFIKIS